MRVFCTLCLLCLPVGALGAITGPTSSSSGAFTLQWQYGQLREVDSSGVLIATYTGTSRSFAKSPGTYYFQELWCGTVAFVGYLCYPYDSHQVTVSGNSAGGTYPQNYRKQAAYNYRIRSGDFDRNGRTDLYVERLTSGPADGSMQSYVVWNNTNGTLSTSALTSTYATVARNAPINNVLNLMHTDANADGFVDHIIERIDQVMGSNLQQELAVFAPGTAVNKSVPQGSTQVTQNFRSFFLDIARWMNNQAYFRQNISTTTIPIYAFGYTCFGAPWSDTNYGFVGRFCFPYTYIVGYRTVRYGVNFSALAATTHMDNAAKRGSIPSENDLWQISQIARGVIGVHLFGFDERGNRRTTNHGEVDDAYDRFKAYMNFLYFAVAAAEDESDSYPTLEHDYEVETLICSIATSTSNWCTLANIACWARHYHAPDKQGGYNKPVTHGERSVLEGPGGYDSPIQTGVGTDGNLPENAIGNITQPSHPLHNSEMGGFGTCPQTVPDQGDGTPPAACNQVYREPFKVGDREIRMRTRGTGENNWDWVNEREGPGLFKELDKEMIEAIRKKADHLCPSASAGS